MCEDDVHSANRHLLAKNSPAEDDIEQTFVEEFVQVLRDWHDDVLSALSDDQLPLAADQALRRALGRILDEHRDAIRATFTTLYEDGAAAGRATTAQRYDLDVSNELSESLIRELQDLATEAADETGERMTDDIAAALQDAWADDIGIPEMERILREEVFPDMEGYEAERAARTNGTTAAGRGQLSSLRDSGAVGKEWLAEDGPRTRDSHDEADGQVVPIGSDFDVGGESARFPGDPRLSMEERANCRCGMAPAWTL